MAFENLNPQGVGLAIAGAPTAGTTNVQTLTIGGTPTGGSFTLKFGDYYTSAIAWTATDATLATRIQTALQALPNVGSGNLTCAVGTGSSGIGTYVISGAGAWAKKSVGAITAGSNNLSGSSPTIAMAVTTAGVDATLLGAYAGVGIHDYTGPRGYMNVGTPNQPQFVRTGNYNAYVSLAGTTGTIGGSLGSWTPAEGGPVIIKRATVYVSAASTGAANINVGVAANATTSANNLITAAAINGITPPDVLDNITNKGASGKETKILPAGSYVTATGSADTSGFAGTLFIEYFKP